MERLRGSRLGAYRLEAMLGQGNRSSVYQATHDASGETVAIRVFDRELSADRAFTERFLHQTSLLAQIHHPNLLVNSDYGQHEGQAYIVRPFIEGGSFRRLLGQPLPLLSVISTLRPIAAALDYAHVHGIVHGDVKPGSILLPRNGPVLLSDLGVAQLLPRGNSLLMAATGRYYGTPEYLSPEQAHGLALARETDTYTLAIILYEALVGRPPFRPETPADTPRTIASRHIMTPPPPPSSLNPALDAGVEEVLLRALDKDPERRFASCIALIAALEDVAAPMAVSTAVLARLPEPAAGPEEATPPAEAWTTTAPDASPDALDRLAAQHEAEVRVLTAAYEEQIASAMALVRDREAMIGSLGQELVAAREEVARQRARLELLATVEGERDALLARLRSLEGRGEPAPRAEEAWPEPLPAAADADLPSGHLAIVEPARFGLPPGTSFVIHSGATVGRHVESAVHLDDHFVSARHARLTREADGWWLTDLGATNGTFVNETRVKLPTRLSRGDVLRFGRIRANFS